MYGNSDILCYMLYVVDLKQFFNQLKRIKILSYF